MSRRGKAGEAKDEAWLKIYQFQQKAFEETNKQKAVVAKQTQHTMRRELNSQMEVGNQRHHKAHQIKQLELKKERLEYEQWVAEERAKSESMKGKVMTQKQARDIQIADRKSRRRDEQSERRKAEAEETFKIKAEIQRAKEEAIAKKLAEKARLKSVFEAVEEQKRLKEIEKEKLAAEDRLAAKQYEAMLNKQEADRASYFIRKVSNNEAMVKKLDDVFGAAERRRLQKETESLESRVRNEDARLSKAAIDKEAARQAAVAERLNTLHAQVAEKEARARREKEMERKAADDMRRMAEKASQEHEMKGRQRHQKLMEYRMGLEDQMRGTVRANFPMSETEKRLNSNLLSVAERSRQGGLSPQELKRYSSAF